MTVNTHLTHLSSSLVLSGAEKLSITRSINTLNLRLTSYFGESLNEQFQFGSSMRGTILPRVADYKSDIDYMVVLNTSNEIEKKPQTYLDRLRRFSDSRYSSSEIHQSSPTIVLSLNHINFELVPSLPEPVGYRIPSLSSCWTDWQMTYPYAANKAITDKNKTELSLIKPLVRLIKYWNASNGYPLSSYFIEEYIVSQNYFGCYSLKDYFYSFWQGISCSYSSPQSTKTKVARAKTISAKAKEFELSGMPYSAESEIKKIVPTL